MVDSRTHLEIGEHSQRSERSTDAPLPFDPPIVVDSDPIEPFIATSLEDPPILGADGPISGVAMSTVNPETGRAHLVYVSENLGALVGRSPFDLLGRSPALLLSPGTPLQQLSAVADVVDGGKQAIVDLGLRHADGHDVPVRASFLAVPTFTGRGPYYLSLFRDPAADRRRPTPPDHLDLLDALARGHELGEMLRRVADRVEQHVPDSVCLIALTDPAGALEPAVGANFRVETIADLAEVVAANLASRTTGRFITESGGASTPCCLKVDDLPIDIGLALRQNEVNAIWAFPFDGADHRLRGLLMVAHHDRFRPHPAEQPMLLQLSRLLAVSVERTSAEADLAHRALHDPLTQLPNRALIVDRLEQAVARLGRDHTRLAVLLVDLDRFKALNDTRGPDVGDQVLVEVARRLRRSVRLGDTVGRIGGDQFLVLCVAMNDEADASAMAARISSNLEPEIEIEGDDEVVISSSVGVVLVDRPGPSPASIISSAESALARAVEENRGSYALYEEDWQRNVVIRHEMEQDLQNAIAENELVLHYQPVVDIRTRSMVGAEALLRWNRPDHGLVGPNEFIDVAEQSGLIVPVGAWVIDEVCRRVAAWPSVKGLMKPVVSINLSARQLSDDSLIRTVLAAIERHGTRPAQLAFEVTESMRVDEMETAVVSLRALNELGCKISIDDFGIGHATLDYLRRFSMADTIKIDRSFVDGLGISREDTAIVTASLALAESLGLAVVAEGVETADQFETLAALGCTYAQGYGLSRPVPLDEAQRLWSRGTLEVSPPAGN